MAISPTRYSSPSSAHYKGPSPFDALALRITQLAIQVLFSCVMIWMGASLLPLAYKEITLTAVALGSAFIGASFFDFESVPSEVLISEPPVVIGPDVPRGIVREGNNCWVNSMLQLLLSSKTASRWVGESETFPERLMLLRSFYQAYNKAVEQGVTNVSYPSQTIREMISERSHRRISCLSGTQEDVHEGLKCILDPRFYPEAVRIEERAHYDTEGLPAIAESELGIREKTDLCLDLSIGISGEAPFGLEQILRNYFEEVPEDQSIEAMGVDGQMHRYKANKVERQYLTAPSELWIHIKRFEYVHPKSPQRKGRFVKNHSPVQVSEQISIQPKEGPLATYRLNAHVNHTGAYGGGHYMAYRQEGDNLYCCNDSSVTLVAPEDQEKVRSQAYLVHYERVL